MISQTTPAGFKPASRARSTDASVCPARRSTPPARARSGKTCPGETRCWRPLLGSMATWIVRERSAAEIPVETPSRASIEIVKSVPSGASFRFVIGGNPSSSQRLSVRQRQMRPRPCVAMKLIASGVANWAAIVKSPSFSRSAASTTTTKRPALISSIASSTVANPVVTSWCIARIVYPSPATLGAEQPLDVLRQHVHLEVDGIARSQVAERGHRERVRDERDGKGVRFQLSDRERDAVDGDRALLDAVPQDVDGRLDPEAGAVAPGPQRAHRANPVHAAPDGVGAAAPPR